MKKYLQKKLNNEKGMTLIELLAVIVIIAIIAAIAIPAIGNIIENSRYGAAKSDVLNAFSAANLYIAEEDGDPTDVADIIPVYMENSGTLATDALFDRDATDKLTISGTVTVDGENKTLAATNRDTLAAMSSQEFKEELNPSTP